MHTCSLYYTHTSAHIQAHTGTQLRLLLAYIFTYIHNASSLPLPPFCSLSLFRVHFQNFAIFLLCVKITSGIWCRVSVCVCVSVVCVCVCRRVWALQGLLWGRTSVFCCFSSIFIIFLKLKVCDECAPVCENVCTSMCVSVCVWEMTEKCIWHRKNGQSNKAKFSWAYKKQFSSLFTSFSQPFQCLKWFTSCPLEGQQVVWQRGYTQGRRGEWKEEREGEVWVNPNQNLLCGSLRYVQLTLSFDCVDCIRLKKKPVNLFNFAWTFFVPPPLHTPFI